jgi:excisionase family DNA binding protein
MIEKQIYTPSELAPVLGRSKSWVVERCQAGTLPALRDGNRWLLRRSDLIRSGWITPTCAHESTPVSETPTGHKHRCSGLKALDV